MRIIQIAPIVEYSDYGSEDRGTFQRLPDVQPTIYGLGDDGQVYRWLGKNKPKWVPWQTEINL